MVPEKLITTRFKDRLASAAADPDAWAEALHDISDQTGSTGAILFHRSAMPGTPVSRGVAEGMETYWKDGWITRDIRMRGIPKQLATGLATDEDCATIDELSHAALYSDFLGRFGLKWFAGVGFKVANQMWCLSIQRSPRQGHFEETEKRVLRQMSRLMTEVGELSHIVAEAKTMGLTAALDRFGDYWITYDFLGRPVAYSTTDRRLSRRPESFAGLARKEPVASHFAQALAALRKGGYFAGGCFEKTVAVPDAVVTVKAIRLTNIHAGFGRAQYLVALRENCLPALPDAETLRRRYGLTPSESMLALAIAEGLSLREAADMREITYETARSQLKSIFSKLGIHRQSQLVGLLKFS